LQNLDELRSEGSKMRGLNPTALSLDRTFSPPLSLGLVAR